MLKKIIELAVQKKYMVLLGVCFMALYGVYETTKLPIDALPDITNNQVQIITLAPALSALDIERQVTFPIEQATLNIPGVVENRSFSRFGLSLVTIVFTDKTNIYWARQQVTERLNQIRNDIPKGVGEPTLAPVTTGLGEIYQYVIKPKKGYENKYSLTDLRTIQDWVIRRQLLGVKGVADVSSFGGLLKQYEVSISLEKLKASNTTIQEVFDALEKNNQNTGGSYIEAGPLALTIRTEGLLKTVADIENMPIKQNNSKTPLYIKNVADITIGHATRYGALTYNGNEAAGAIVMMIKGGNSSQIIKNIKEKIVEIERTLPEGVEIEPFLDRTKMVDNSVKTVSKNLLEGCLIVVFVLVFFLGNFRAGFLVASVIPLSMLFTISMMNLFGVSGNLMSLGALDFGLIVDGSVIIVEAVLHSLAKHNIIQTKSDFQDEVKNTTSSMMQSAVFGQLIILLVYLPILTLEGIEGKMFLPMAQTVIFALLGAFLLSITYVPAMSSLILYSKKKNQHGFSDAWFGKIETLYIKWLQKFLQIPTLVISGILIVFFISIFILTRLGGEFIPVIEEGDFAVETMLLTGSNIPESIKQGSKAAKLLLKEFPEVEKVVGKIGSSEIPTDPMPMNAQDLMVILKNKSEWTSASTYEELAEKMQKKLEQIPGVNFGITYPVQMRFNELMTGAKQDVVCKIYGENIDTLAAYSAKLGSIARKIQGTENVYVEPIEGMPQIRINYNRSALAQYQISVNEVNNIVQAAFAGEKAGQVFEEEKRFDLVVRLKGAQNKNVQDVQNLLIQSTNGIQIPLNQLASITVENAPNQIQREMGQRRIIVGFNVRNRDIQSVVEDVQKSVLKNIKFPSGYHIQYGGTFKNLEEAKTRLAIAVPISLVLIFLMLFFAFRSFAESALIYSTIPVSAIGGIWALWLRGLPFSISAGVGFIALFGIAVLNGIVLMSEFKKIKLRGEHSILDIILQGTKNRLRPVLMTASVASLGFLPMAISTSEGAQVQRPLATVVIGGLVSATFLTLILLPILYAWYYGKKKNVSTKLAVILCFVFAAKTASAQEVISLNSAIEMATKNNAQIQKNKLQTDYAKKLIKSNTILPNTTISTEYGQVNSYYKDAKVGIIQGFSIPSTYKKQQKIAEATWEKSILEEKNTTREITRNIQTIFYTYAYLQEKNNVLVDEKKRYDEVYKRALLRYEKGEDAILEKISGESNLITIQSEIQDIEAEKNILLEELQFILGSDKLYIPENKLPKKIGVDTSSIAIANNPLIEIAAQDIKISESITAFEKTKLLPDFSLGYFNQSFNGVQNVHGIETTYNSSNRFSSVLFSVGIPIFNSGQRKKIQAASLYQQVVQQEKKIVQNNLEKEIHQALLSYRKNNQKVTLLEQKTIQQIQQIYTITNQKLHAGDINYIEWSMLQNQAVMIQKNYLDALYNLNLSGIQFNYLINK